MKIKRNGKTLNVYQSMAGVLFALTSFAGHAGTMGPATVAPPGNIYFGVFGGAGASNKTEINQYGTAFFTEAVGGPLAVDAFGRTNSRTVGIVGAHVGYQWTNFLASAFNSNWGLVPAFELEGYYLGKSKFKGHEISNNTVRLPEHDFLVTYPMNAGVFLTNAVLNLNISDSRFHPYVGAGIGGAVVSISHARAIQVSPPEIGVNHYNSKTNDNESTFAGQVKVGSSFDVSQHLSVFAEYRWLYLAATNYTFGSTVYPGHAATSAWNVNLNSQKYNMGALGVRYTV